MWRDLRLAGRSLVRSLPFTLATTFALGLAIGANASIFSLVDGLWFRPAGFRDVGRSVRVFSTSEAARTDGWSYPEYLELRERARSLEGVVARGRRGTVVSWRGSRPDLALVNVVSADFFSALGIEAASGRVFGSADEAAGTDAVVVLGHAYWRRTFGGDPAVVGQSLSMGSGPMPARILGVLPASFRDLDAAADRDLWLPPSTWRRLGGPSDFENRAFRWFDVLAIRRSGAGLAAANAEVAAFAATLEAEFPGTNAGRGARVVSDLAYRMESGGANALALVALVVLVVLIACVNVSNLMLSRAIGRREELAVRVALGASRTQLLRQTLAESVLLCGLGLATGLMLSLWLIRLLPAFLVQPPGFPTLSWFGIDDRVLAMTFGAALVTAALSTLAPIWTIARGDVSRIIHAGARVANPARARRRFGGLLITAQVAVSLVLIVAAAVLTRSFVETRRADLGFAYERILAAWVAPAPPAAVSRDAVDRLASMPGVARVAVAIRAPLSLSGGGLARRLQIAGPDEREAGTEPEVKYGAVSSNYFDVMGIRRIEGRTFDAADEGPGAPVIVVNEPFATRFLGSARPATGRMVRIGAVEHRVIGVVRSAVINAIGEAPEPYFYLPFWRGAYGELTYLLEAQGDAAALASSAGRVLADLDARLEPRRLVALDQYVRYSAADYQATAALAGALGIVGLVLTAFGVHGVMAYRTSRRLKEIGIRMAFGAARSQVLALVAKEGGRIALAGLAVGLPASLVATQWLQSFLFGIGPWDAVAFVGGATLIAATVALATLLPAWRAARVDPSIALRDR